MKSLFDLKDKIIIVTGGLGFLGREYCQYLLGQGAKVACWDLPNRGIVGHPSSNYWIFGLDITQEYQIVDAVNIIEKEWGAPDGLINNAALDFPPQEQNNEWANLEEALKVNVVGTINCCDIVGTVMAARGYGSIINIGSIYGMHSPDQRIYSEGFKKPIAYTASKSSLIGTTKYLATYWAKQNVRVNLLTLGGVFNSQHHEFIAKYVSRIPKGRMAMPDDYFGPIHYLLSDASIYMTGANIVVDGGFSAW